MKNKKILINSLTSLLLLLIAVTYFSLSLIKNKLTKTNYSDKITKTIKKPTPENKKTISSLKPSTSNNTSESKTTADASKDKIEETVPSISEQVTNTITNNEVTTSNTNINQNSQDSISLDSSTEAVSQPNYEKSQEELATGLTQQTLDENAYNQALYEWQNNNGFASDHTENGTLRY